MEDNRFDLEIRSMLENAREDVPEGLWQGIESRLPAPAKARPAAIWWKIASATGAVAAAVALTVFFSTRPVVQNPVDIIPSQDSGLSQLMETPLAPETGNMKPLSISQAFGESVSETDGEDVTETAGESVVEKSTAGDPAAGTAGKEGLSLRLPERALWKRMPQPERPGRKRQPRQQERKKQPWQMKRQ